MDNSRPKYKKELDIFWGEYKIFWGEYSSLWMPRINTAICNVSQPAFKRKLKLQQHTVPYHNTTYAYLSHIQFLVRKTGCIWVLTSI